ncbi:MAG: PorT family protein [Flavobacteriales bacterium]|nr:PorT family protein [Flavobacteriales bacterium]
MIRWSILVLMVLYARIIASQEPLRMGIRAGMNFAQISGVGMQGFNKFGVLAGVGLHWRFKPKWSFDPEITYSMKGARKNPNVDAGDYTTYTIEADYLEVPALFGWHMDKKDRFTLDFGITMGVLIRERVEQNGAQLTQGRGFNRFELGAALGVTYHLTKNWAFQFRMQNSIIPIKPYASGQTAILPLWGIIRIGEVHTVISISLQYNFGFLPDVNESPRIKKEKLPRETKPKKQNGNIIDEE